MARRSVELSISCSVNFLIASFNISSISRSLVSASLVVFLNYIAFLIMWWFFSKFSKWLGRKLSNSLSFVFLRSPRSLSKALSLNSLSLSALVTGSARDLLLCFFVVFLRFNSSFYILSNLLENCYSSFFRLEMIVGKLQSPISFLISSIWYYVSWISVNRD